MCVTNDVEHKLRSSQEIVEEANGCQRHVAGEGERGVGGSGREGEGESEMMPAEGMSAGMSPGTAVQPEHTGRREQSFLDWLGHELRNPIAVIELAVHSLRQLGDERLDQPLSILERQAGQLGRVVLELLEMARAVAPPGMATPVRYLPRDDDPMRLPMHQRLPRGSDATSRPSLRAKGTGPVRQRLLLVEDNQDLSDLLREMLIDWGFEVVTASNATTALARAAVRPPDVALIDIGLPDRDGCEVARALRRSLPPSVRLIAMSGFGQRHDGARALGSGFDEYLVKPLNMTRLRLLLGEIPSISVARTPSEK